MKDELKRPASGGKSLSGNDDLFKKRTKESASQYVVRSIQEAIRSGDLKIGDALPCETELAEKLGVGRSSVREGIRSLIAFGILEVKRGRGTFVVDNFVESLFNMLGFSLVGDNLGYFLAARRVLECGCIKMNQNSFASKELDELEALANALSPHNTLKDNINYDRMFHNKLIQHTGNTMMMRIYDMIGGLLWELMESLMCYEDVLTEAQKAHLNIVAALRVDDMQAAERAMSQHLGKVENYSQDRMVDGAGVFTALEDTTRTRRRKESDER